MSSEPPELTHVPGQRLESEMVWVRWHSFLVDCGYKTRARYQPDWVGSWVNNPKAPMRLMCEDGIWSLKYNILDAIRVLDGTPVMMKIIDTNYDHCSVPQMQYFSEGDRRDDARNHCVPLLDLLCPDGGSNQVILVQPRLVPWDLWPFRRVDEVVDFLQQVFEGIAYMHDHHTAHLDASWGNIMMDGLHLFLEPNHPSQPRTKACGEGKARHISRHEAKQPVKYYFIDFDTSVRFPDFAARHPIRRERGQDDTVPEERLPGPYDAFKVDIYCLGHLILTHLLNAYVNVEFIRPLAEQMMREDPTERPTAQQVVDTFALIRQSLSPRQLRSSPGHIRSYDFVDYIAGDIPARRPSRSFASIVAGLWRRRARSKAAVGNQSAIVPRKSGPLLSESVLRPSQSHS